MIDSLQRLGKGLGRLLHRRGEWVFVIAALLAALSAVLGIAPTSNASAYIASTFGVAVVIIGLYTVWMIRSRRRAHARPVIALVGVPVAVYLAILPDLLGGQMNDDSTGTVASVFLAMLIVAACVPAGMLAGILVLLPAGIAVYGLALAASGRVAGLGVIVVALFPLTVVAGGVAGALAMDNVPLSAGPWLTAGGLAMIARAFGVDNGVRIVDPVALTWFRVFVIVDLLYLVGLFAVSRTPRRTI